jgi:hypothetical protein
MSLDIELRLGAPRMSVHESLHVTATLRNRGASPMRLPTPDDTSDAYTFELLDEHAGVVRRINGLTGQMLGGTARVDGRRSLGWLAAGATWDGEWDLGQLHLPLPAGSFALRLALQGSDDGDDTASPPASLQVDDSVPVHVQAWRDAPLRDMTTVLVDTGAQGLYLRQLASNRPLAAEATSRLDLAPGSRVVCAASDFVDGTSFDSVFERLLLAERDGTVDVRLHVNGRATGPVTRAQMPLGWHLVDGAWRDDLQRLHMFASDGRDTACWGLKGDRLQPEFTLPTPPPGTRLAAWQVIDGIVHLAWASARGVAHLQLDASGRLQQRRDHGEAARWPLSRCAFDRVTRQLLVACHDAPHGRRMLLGVVELDGSGARWQIHDALPISGDVSEFSFGADRVGRFHLVVATSRGRLLYFVDGRGPTCLARQSAPFHPLVVAGRDVYLGFYGVGRGYGFVQLLGRHGRPSCRSFEMAGSA